MFTSCHLLVLSRFLFYIVLIQSFIYRFIVFRQFVNNFLSEKKIIHVSKFVTWHKTEFPLEILCHKCNGLYETKVIGFLQDNCLRDVAFNFVFISIHFCIVGKVFIRFVYLKVLSLIKHVTDGKRYFIGKHIHFMIY